MLWPDLEELRTKAERKWDFPDVPNKTVFTVTGATNEGKPSIKAKGSYHSAVPPDHPPDHGADLPVREHPPHPGEAARPHPGR